MFARLCVLAVAIGCLPALASASLVVNPNFDQPGAGAETHEDPGTYLVGSSGWQALGTTANFAGGATYSQFGAAYNGATYYGELNNFGGAGTGAGGWQQVISTTPGIVYNLSYAYNYLSPNDGIPTAFSALVYGGSVAYNDASQTPIASQSETVADRGFGVQQPWFTTSFNFTATSNETTIRFASGEWHTNAFGPAIDGVSVVAITPEPSSVVLWGLGAIGLFVAARIRRAG